MIILLVWSKKEKCSQIHFVLLVHLGLGKNLFLLVVLRASFITHVAPGQLSLQGSRLVFPHVNWFCICFVAWTITHVSLLFVWLELPYYHSHSNMTWFVLFLDALGKHERSVISPEYEPHWNLLMGGFAHRSAKVLSVFFLKFLPLLLEQASYYTAHMTG